MVEVKKLWLILVLNLLCVITHKMQDYDLQILFKIISKLKCKFSKTIIIYLMI
jgi:hypothetical protein